MGSALEKFKAVMVLGLVDLLFLIVMIGILALVANWKKPAYAVLKRNFVAYFTNPTGYVFLCLFVWLASIAAFWPDEFFADNLANLDQLNRMLPLIMLVFIPAITMSIWAEERRQGTDELLLTIPAGDFDIVLGKYLAAASIFTVSLLFSQVAIFLVLINLGDPDIGLFLGNYFGYWLVGLALLAVGMVASFLTRNLTVGFILGAIFCSFLVFPAYANVVGLSDEAARRVSAFSIAEKFRDFQGGVVTLSGLIYFGAIVAVSLYLCLVLIGRRHWSGGRDGRAMGGHYLLRTVSLVVIGASVSVAAAAMPLFRWDVTAERLSSLSPASVNLIKDVIKPKIADWRRSDMTSVHLDNSGDNHFVSIAANEERKPVYVAQDVNLQSQWKSLDLSAKLRIAKGEKDGDSTVTVVEARFLKEDGAQTGDTIRVRSNPGDEWHDVTKNAIAIPAGAERLTLRLGRFGSGGQVDADDVVLKCASEDKDAPAATPIKNGDFEKIEDIYAIKIEAFISSDLPEEFVQRRLDLLATLREIKSVGGEKIKLRIYDGIDLFGPVASRAADYYGIQAETVETKTRGATKTSEIIFGVAVESALERSVTPFLAASLPIEYELMRSLATVTQQERKKIGILVTDLNLMTTPAAFRDRSEHHVVEELKKQYEVVSIDPNEPIDMNACDVLLAVQPSSLSPPPGGQDPGKPAKGPMDNFIDAVRNGMPTMILEDPLPFTFAVTGTSQPKQPPGGMFGRQPPEPKGDMKPLWDLLGIDLARQPSSAMSFHGGTTGDEALIAWQEYNPHPEMSDRIWNEWIWITPNNRAEEAFNESSEISSGLQKMLFLFPGGMEETGLAGIDREIVPLVRTGTDNSGTVAYGDVFRFFGMSLKSPDQLARDEQRRFNDQEARRDNPAHRGWISLAESFQYRNREKIEANGRTRAKWVPVSDDQKSRVTGNDNLVSRDRDGALEQLIIVGEYDYDYILAARVRQKKAASGDKADEGGDASDKKRDLDVIVVSDIDWISGYFFELRKSGQLGGMPETARWDLDNVTFLLNALDALAGDDRFIEIRKRRPKHRELTTVQLVTDAARKERDEARQKADLEVRNAIEKAEKEFNAKKKALDPLKKTNPARYQQEMDILVERINNQVEAKKAELDRKKEKEFQSIDNQMAAKIHDVQDGYKRLAVALPPIPPLLIAICVFFVRRSREDEGVAASRRVK